VRNENLFSTADFYSSNLRKLRHEVWDIHAKNEWMQKCGQEGDCSCGEQRKRKSCENDQRVRRSLSGMRKAGRAGDRVESGVGRWVGVCFCPFRCNSSYDLRGRIAGNRIQVSEKTLVDSSDFSSRYTIHFTNFRENR
jgi:hypothetical protein